MFKKVISVFVVVALLLICGGVRATQNEFVKTKGTHFVLDGRPLYFNGFNAYWLMYQAADPSPSTKDMVTKTLKQASDHGVNLIRTWAFNDGAYRALQITPGTYDEKVFQGLDYAVSEAKKHGIYLILTLVNNWEGFGGKKQYVQWARDQGHYLNNEDDFFTSPITKDYYKNHIKTVLTRVNSITGVAYKNDPTIFAWELMNEPRSQSDLSGKAIQDWAAEMASYVKSIDSNHLVDIGMEGFYGESMPEKKQANPGYEVGTDFIANNRIPDIDFSTIHMYPDQWVSGANEDAQNKFVQNWIQAHINDSQLVIGKPMIVSEFGKSSRSSGYSVEARDTYLGNVFNDVYDCARAGGPCGGALFWQIMAEGMENWSDGYEVFFEKSPSTAGVIDQQSRRIASLNKMNHEVRATKNDFIQTKGNHFVLDDRPLYFNGFNAYWLMYQAADPSPSTKEMVTTTLKEASDHGVNLIRTWAFNDGAYRALQITPGTYDEKVFQGLDYTVSEAKKHGIYLILSLVNNWEGFGGKKQYVQWARDQGHYLNNEDDFFTSPITKDYYKNHIKAVLTRVNSITGVAYKDDPTIFAWELMNEPRCQSDLSGKAIQDWVAEMAAYVKSIDSNHLVEVGMEGFYGESMPEKKQANPGYEVGTDFIANNRIPDIDFSTIHMYPDQWVSGANEEAQAKFVENWIKAHVNDSQLVIGKPILVSEFGKSSRSSGYSVGARDLYLGNVFNDVYDCARAGGPCGGALFWQVMAVGMENWSDGYEVFLAESPSTSAVIDQQSRRIASLNKMNVLESVTDNIDKIAHDI